MQLGGNLFKGIYLFYFQYWLKSDSGNTLICTFLQCWFLSWEPLLGREKKKEWARRMSGLIVFLPHSELTTGWGIFSCCASSSLSFPLLFLPPCLWKTSFYKGLKFFPPFFSSHQCLTSSVQSRVVVGVHALPLDHYFSPWIPSLPVPLHL